MDDPRLGLPSASSIERLALCPGSHRLSAGLAPITTPEQREWAESGDRIHLWLESPGFIDLKEDELVTANKCEDHREQIMDMAMPDRASLERGVIKESRLWLYDDAGNPIFSGQIDYGEVVQQKPHVAAVTDYKTNRGDVTDNVKNPQTRSHAVLLATALNWEVDRIYTGVVQPLVHHKAEPPCCYTKDHLLAADKQIRRWLKAAEQEDAPLVPGEKQCKYCPAKLKCPAAARFYWDIAATTPEQVTGATGAQLSALLDKTKVAAQIIDMVDAQAKELLAKDPAAIPNWQLEPNSPVREITDPNAIFKSLAGAGKIDAEAFLTTVKCGVGKLELAVRDFNALKGKPKLVDAIFEEHCDPYINLKPKAPSLKRV
jgi:hypothetical protein